MMMMTKTKKRRLIFQFFIRFHFVFTYYFVFLFTVLVNIYISIFFLHISASGMKLSRMLSEWNIKHNRKMNENTFCTGENKKNKKKKKKKKNIKRLRANWLSELKSKCISFLDGFSFRLLFFVSSEFHFGSINSHSLYFSVEKAMPTT